VQAMGIGQMTLVMAFARTSGQPTSLPFWLMTGAAAGIYLFCHGFFLLQRKRLIMNTPVSKVRSAAMGLVEISGLANGPYALTAPITGAPCYYCRTVVWRWEREGKNSKWVKAADENLHVPFYLEDNTGRVLVDPQGAEMDIHRDFHEEFNQELLASNFGMPPNMSGFLLTHGISSTGRIKVEEYCIKPKNALFILGTLAHNPGITVSTTPVRSLPQNSVSFSASLGSRLSSSRGITLHLPKDSGGLQAAVVPSTPHVADPAQQAKIAAVLTKAGISNPAAWAAAGVSPVQTTAVATTNSSGAAAAPGVEQFDLHPPTVLMKGTHDRNFFISWQSQREVVQSLGWKSALMIWGGPALTLISVYFMAAAHGWF
jgi:hypothetical protein